MEELSKNVAFSTSVLEKNPKTPVFKKQCYFLKSDKGKAAYFLHLHESWLYAGSKDFQKSPMCKECLKHLFFLGYIFNFLYIALNLLLWFKGEKITTNKENSCLFLIAETWFVNGYEFF